MLHHSGKGPRPTKSEIENSKLEVWGGAEYTCNRVGDRYFDQMDLSGHAERSSDYCLFAGLGIRTFRFGLLWERYERNPARSTGSEVDSSRRCRPNLWNSGASIHLRASERTPVAVVRPALWHGRP